MKADWHQNSVATELQEAAAEVDPFDSPQSFLAMATHSTSQAITDVPMKPISVDTPQAELRADLAGLVRREARLHDAGITCELKDNDEMSCLACPVSKAADTDDPLCALCRVGCTQEVTVTTLLAQRREHGGGSD